MKNQKTGDGLKTVATLSLMSKDLHHRKSGFTKQSLAGLGVHSQNSTWGGGLPPEFSVCDLIGPNLIFRYLLESQLLGFLTDYFSPSDFSSAF